jgi:UDP-3-O-[3-hydroxymyristoyl] glucosamine N-acyltransferase LpxD
MIKALKIADFIGSKLCGEDVTIKLCSSLDSIHPNAVLFSVQYSDKIRDILNGSEDILVIASLDYDSQLTCAHILVENPRLAFAKVVKKFFADNRSASRITDTSIIGANVNIGRNVSIGEYTLIGDNVMIGDNSEIRHHVVIANNTVIGSECIIRSHNVIGEESYGLAKDNLDGPIEMVPQIGNVVIGNNVEIGSFNTINRGAIDSTILRDNVKMTHHINIAHNVVIGENTFISACAEISGSVTIGKGAWIAPNASILEHVKIGDFAMVGIGAVVIKDIEIGKVVVGNPAKVLKDRRPKGTE